MPKPKGRGRGQKRQSDEQQPPPSRGRGGQAQHGSLGARPSESSSRPGEFVSGRFQSAEGSSDASGSSHDASRGQPAQQMSRQTQQMYRPPGARETPAQPAAPQMPRTPAVQMPPPGARETPAQPAAPQMPRTPAVQMPSPGARQTPVRPAAPQMPPSGARAQEHRAQEQEILKSFQSVSLKSKSKMAKRPGYLTIGRPINLIANYFLLKYKDITIYHYDVDIVYLRGRRKETEGDSKKKEPKESDVSHRKGASVLQEGRTAQEAAKKGVSHVEHQQARLPGKQRCKEVITKMIENKNFAKFNPVYDGQKNIYTTALLPIKGKEKYVVSLDEGHRFIDFEVVIQPVEKQSGGGNAISLRPLEDVLNKRTDEIPYEIIMALDTVMSHRSPNIRPEYSQVQVGRSFFLLRQRNVKGLGEGIEIWFGYNQSIHLTERGPAVIINYSAKAFHKTGSVIEYACEILNNDIRRMNAMDPRDIHDLSEALSKVRVQVTHMGRSYKRKYTVKKLTKVGARDLKFSYNGENITVAQYFKNAYKLTLQYPDLPCLHMKTSSDSTFMPIEVCEVVANQPKLGKLSGKMTSDMIRQTAIPPNIRFDKIMGETQQIKNVSGNTMNAFGLGSEFQFMKLQGRVMESPNLQYQNEKVDPRGQGKWRLEDRVQFLKTTPKCSWVLISFVNPRFCNEQALSNLAYVLCQTAHKLGMGLEKVRDIKIFSRRESVQQALGYVRQYQVDFAVVVLSPNDQARSYEELKFLADIKMRITTQCIKDAVVKKFNNQVALNLLLKINAKVGGINHTLYQKPRLFERPAIVFGADAAHSPRGFSCPSIAAVVGSMDAHASQYAVTCRVQDNPDDKKLSQEIILDMKDMVKQILRAFKNNTRGKYPERILFFRDGVSEGQFKTVLEEEIPQIQEACKEELNENIPPMTYIVVQKRHQTRFIPQRKEDGFGKMGNIPPGTTVDRDVTHPVLWDFFICSHEGIQGTSKPAHYTVIFDENNFTANELYKMCYDLCHTYVRCNRSVSIPPPVMYADLACTRAKKYADYFINKDSHSTISSGSSGRQRLPEEVESAINDGMATIKNGMFYV